MIIEPASRKRTLLRCRPWIFTAVLVMVWSNIADRADAQTKSQAKTSTALKQADKWQKEYEALYEKGKYGEALLLAEKVLAIRERAQGRNHPDVAQALNDVAVLLQFAKEDYKRAIPLQERALTIWKQSLGNNNPIVAKSLDDLGMLHYGNGDYEHALLLLEQALDIREQTLGKVHPGVATSLNNLALVLQYKGDYERALPLLERAVVIDEKTLGKNHPDAANSLSNLALLHYSKGDYKKALPMFERALAIQEKALGEYHPGVAVSLNNLAALYWSNGDYERALPLLEQAITIKEAALGKNHPKMAISLNNLAELHRTKGDYERALPLLARALAIRESALGKNHPDVGDSLNNLGVLHGAKGDYEQAMSFHERALAIAENVLGKDHPSIATSLSNLAAVHHHKGDYEQALRLVERALVIRERVLGENHPDVGDSLNNLAALYEATGDYERALPFHERALAIRASALGKNHPEVAQSLNNLATLYQRMGDDKRAVPLQERALAIREKAFGRNHPAVAQSLNNLALLYEAQGDYERALPQLEQSLAIRENRLDPNHPKIIESLNNLAALQSTRGDLDAALDLYERSLHTLGHVLRVWLRDGSERQHFYYLAKLHYTYVPLSFHLRVTSENPRAARLAMNIILIHRARVLDVSTDTMRAAREHSSADNRAKLHELERMTAELSHLVNKGPGTKKADRERYARRRVKLENKIATLDAELTRDNVAYRQLTRDVWVEDVQTKLPKDAALISFFIYRPYSFHAPGVKVADRFGERHYAAYVLRSSGDVRGIDLGPARVIDEEVAKMHAAMSQFRRDAREHARRVDARVMQPVRALLGDAQRIYLVPDGPLSFVPFEAMLDEHGHYLVERYSFTYLASERDLVQRLPHVSKPGPAVVIADPRYDSRATMANPKTPDAQRSREYARQPAEPLPGTRREAEALRSLLPDALVWTGNDASETALKTVKNPRILHIATHGFFLPDQEFASDEKAMASFSPERWAPPRVPVENGMLRSGLLFAGANQMRDPGGDNDGVLTALEASNLRLDGSRLVVLSACDTGRGELRGSQGIYGLRRAFQVAGAETLVMSLWKVNDETTQELMARYYEYLLAGEGRVEAMRRVQLDVLRKGGKLAHPYYWAAFVVSGDDSTLAGTPAKLALSPRSGCAGCNTTDPSTPGLCILALLALHILRRTRRPLPGRRHAER